MSQSRTGSAVEAVTNIGVGLGLNVGLNLLVLPALGFPVRIHDAAIIAAIFTVASLARSYTLRRVFTRLRAFHE